MELHRRIGFAQAVGDGNGPRRGDCVALQQHVAVRIRKLNMAGGADGVQQFLRVVGDGKVYAHAVALAHRAGFVQFQAGKARAQRRHRLIQQGVQVFCRSVLRRKVRAHAAAQIQAGAEKVGKGIEAVLAYPQAAGQSAHGDQNDQRQYHAQLDCTLGFGLHTPSLPKHL